MLSVEEARDQILGAISPLRSARTVRLSLALMRVLASDAISPVRLPRARLSTMDGYALRSSEASMRLQEAGFSAAGEPCLRKIPKRSCVRIATGAIVPDELDCVRPVELSTKSGELIEFENSENDNIRQAGEDIERGETAVHAGELLSSAKSAVLHSLGLTRVKVRGRPIVGVISSGDELRCAGEKLDSGAVYDANRPMLLGIVKRLGCEALDLGMVRDTAENSTAALKRGASECDALICSGGASVGERDFLKQAVASQGELLNWKVAIKPGKPFILGKLDRCHFFGLPGNPASAFVCMMILVAPALWKLAGRDPLPDWPSLPALTLENLVKSPGRADYQRGILTRAEDGGWRVRSAGPQGSASLTVLARANSLIILPRDSADIPAGRMVEVLPLDSFPL